jgi:hypothetical protein
MSQPKRPAPANHWVHADKTDPPVTVRTFARQDERMPVLAFLEAEGVDTHTPDGNTLSIDPGLFVALGFYKIQVPQSQIEKARLLLAEWDEAVPLPDHIDTGEWSVEEIHGPSKGGVSWPTIALVGMGLLLALIVIANSG